MRFLRAACGAVVAMIDPSSATTGISEVDVEAEAPGNGTASPFPAPPLWVTLRRLYIVIIGKLVTPTPSRSGFEGELLRPTAVDRPSATSPNLGGLGLSAVVVTGDYARAQVRDGKPVPPRSNYETVALS